MDRTKWTNLAKACYERPCEVMREHWTAGAARDMEANLPEHMHQGITSYIVMGCIPGDFLQAVLRNDMVGAAGRANEDNKAAFWSWAAFLFNHVPAEARGDLVAWANRGGLVGLPDAPDEDAA